MTPTHALTNVNVATLCSKLGGDAYARAWVHLSTPRRCEVANRSIRMHYCCGSLLRTVQQSVGSCSLALTTLRKSEFRFLPPLFTTATHLSSGRGNHDWVPRSGQGQENFLPLLWLHLGLNANAV